MKLLRAFVSSQKGCALPKHCLSLTNGIFLPIMAFIPFFVSVFNLEYNSLTLLSLNYILECPVNASLSLLCLDLLEKILPKIIHFLLDMYSKVKHGLNLVLKQGNIRLQEN